MSNSVIINCTLPPFFIKPPNYIDGYMIVVRDLLPGIEALSTLPNINSRSCTLIAAHTLECVLKAFLCHKNKADKKIGGHKITKLWNDAYKENLSIPEIPPDWVRILDAGHGPNFYFRYQEGAKDTIVNGGARPELIPMTKELKKLIEMVELAIAVVT
jgi:hypothetical protein